MVAERLVDWHPPAKNHGSENIPELYARMFADQVITMIYAKTCSLNLPVVQGMDTLVSEENDVFERLKQRNQYFYQSGGSIFMDYKIMRDKAFGKIGREMGKEDPEEASVAGYHALKEKFNADMSTEEALELARGIVANWDWN